MKLIGKTIEVLEQAINIRSSRNSVLAGNIANIDTPGYVPRDVNFKKLMENYMNDGQPSEMATTDPSHFTVARSSGSGDRLSLSGSRAGGELAATDPRHFTTASQKSASEPIMYSTEEGTPNSLDLDQEMAKLSANNLQYQAAVTVLIKKFEGLVNAITEGGKQ